MKILKRISFLRYVISVSVLLCSVNAFCEESPKRALLIKALREVNNLSENAFDANEVALSTNKTGYTLKFSHAPGEGSEDCTAEYNQDGVLKTFTCSLWNATHSRGDRNFIVEIKATRKYNLEGVLISARGDEFRKLASTKKQIMSRRIRNLKDPALDELTKPLLRLDKQLLEK